jgi:solute carrier family 13 (sodium-dependent dicarboxylate transporter), member 2/3/5
VSGAHSTAGEFVNRYLPESLIAVGVAWTLFFIPAKRGTTVLTGRDLRMIDWDTLFLIAGGLCIGSVLDASGATRALADAVQSARLPPALLMFAVAATTVVLSEITSNTATATMVVPIAASLAASAGLSAVQATWLVAMAASLGFAFPISTPPNAIVYGTRRVPLSLMFAVGIVLDVLCLAWVVCCVRWCS